MSNEKLLDKIQKMLNMAASSNPNEAAVAMAKAQAMMEEHQLTSRDVAMNQIGEATVKSTQSISNPKGWEVSLVKMIAGAFGMRILWTNGYAHNRDAQGRIDYWGRYSLIGPKDKVQLAEYAVVVLLRQLVKARTEFSKTLKESGYRRGKAMTAQLDGFCYGWIKIVRTKVHKFANTPEIQLLIDARINEIAPGARDAHNRGNGALGNQFGQEAARDVEINRPMNMQETQQLEHNNA